jgi:hypothetical protein
MENHESGLKFFGHREELVSARESCLNYRLSLGSQAEPIYKNLFKIL